MERTKTMHCDAIRSELGRFVDAELPPRRREEIKRHLETCPDCRRALTQLQEVARAFAGAVLPPVPDDFAARVLDRARARVTQPRAVWWWPAAEACRWWRGETPAMRMAAASVVVTGLAVGLALRGGVFVPTAGLPQAVATSPVVPNLGFVGGVPAGSLEQTYLAWVADTPENQP